jgi:hypothetical protein
MNRGEPIVEQVPPVEKRERIRAAWLAAPGFYNPWLHLAVTSVGGIAIVLTGVVLVHHVQWSEIAFGVGLFVASNAAEWRMHRDLLHRRVPPFGLFYDQHTPQHHMVFVTDDMAIRDARELRLVLIPAWGIVAAFASLTPAMIAIWLGGNHNLACVFGIVTVGYVVSYEWLHLSYHLPPESFIGRRCLVRWLARHHAIHHDPRLMQRWNFNVTLPLWDLVRRTYVGDRERALHPGGSRQEAQRC